MENKRVLVIGAGSYSEKNPSIKGIGTCLVERLAKHKDFSVLFTYYKSQEGASRLVRSIKSQHPNFEIDCLRFNSLDYELDWKRLESKLANSELPMFLYIMLD